MYVCIIIDIYYVIYVLREIYVQKSHSLPAHPSRHSRWSTAQCPHSPQSNAPCRGCRRGKEGCACRCTASAGSRPDWLRTSCRQCVWSSLGRCWCPRHPIRLRMCPQVAAENVGNKKLKRASNASEPWQTHLEMAWCQLAGGSQPPQNRKDSWHHPQISRLESKTYSKPPTRC